MNKDPRFEELREQGWRRELSETENAQLEAWLARHPEEKPGWEGEAQLNRVLRSLGDVPVASNFTARVVQAARSERARRTGMAGAVRWLWFGQGRWLPRIAFAALVLTSGLFAYRYVNASRRAEVAHSLAVVSEVAVVPAPELLQDYDAISALNSNPPADEQLLIALTK